MANESGTNRLLFAMLIVVFAWYLMNNGSFSVCKEGKGTKEKFGGSCPVDKGKCPGNKGPYGQECGDPSCWNCDGQFKSHYNSNKHAEALHKGGKAAADAQAHAAATCATNLACAKDGLKACDLLPDTSKLPTDSESKAWVALHPKSDCNLNKNFTGDTKASHGIDTVSNSLRNASLDLRCEPANPRYNISPWQQSTIGFCERRPLDGCNDCGLEAPTGVVNSNKTYLQKNWM